MAVCTLIMGESGTGKSSSLRTLNPEETFIINVLDKPLPFRGFKKHYIQQEGGNYVAFSDHNKIKKVIEAISERNNIKTVIVDDFQYVMAIEFMNRALEKSYDKFTEIQQHAWNLIQASKALRSDLNIFFLSHTETTQQGIVKCKTIGKMLDDKITLEGAFTSVLHSLVVDGQYKFLTQHDGTHIAKTPMDMFADQFIDNDLQYVINKMNEYYNDDSDIH